MRGTRVLMTCRRRWISNSSCRLIPNRREDTSADWRSTQFRQRKIAFPSDRSTTPGISHNRLGDVYNSAIYSQTPLPPRHIRLLTVLPDATESQIRCTLDICPLATAPAYKALSYVWGPREPRTTLTCNEEAVTVRPNLAWALRRMRDQRQPLVLWVDAICIDQSNEVEKSAQVRWMRRIFKQAEEVLVSLGPDDDDRAIAATSLLQRMEQLALNETEGRVPWSGNVGWMPKRADGMPDLPPETDTQWDGVRTFLRLPWFTRSWIVQEAAAASPQSKAFYGHAQISLATIGAAVTWMHQKALLSASDDDITSLSRAFQMWELSEAVLGHRPRPRLFEVLAMSGDYACEDARDKVYSLLGITREGLELEQGRGPQRLSPDYTASVLDIYCNVARYMVDSAMVTNNALHPSMMHLWWCSYHKSQNWPTWIPRWCDYPIDALSYGRGKEVYSACYHASSNISVQTRWLESTRILSIRGLLVDVVGTKFVLDDETWTQKEPRWQVVRKAWSHYCGSLRRDGFIEASDRETEFPLSITGYQYLESSRDAILRDFKAWMCHMQPDDRQRPTEPRWLQAAGSDKGDRDRFSYALWMQMDYNSIFFTAKSHFMGLGLLDVQLGDVLCVIYGCQVPVLLRPIEGHYEFLGLCHVPALRNGLAIQMRDSGEVSEQWFDIH